MTVIIYRNPACGTSRNTPGLIRATGTEPRILDEVPVMLSLVAFASRTRRRCPE